MPRIRTIKPEYWSDEKLAGLDCLTRFVFLGLIGMADDSGRLLDNIKIIDAFVFPETSETCRDALATLSRIGRIIRGKTSSGQKVIQIVNWSKHQKVDKPNNKSCLPAIVENQPEEPPKTLKKPEEIAIRESVANDSRDIRDSDASASRYDRRPTTDDHGPSLCTELEDPSSMQDEEIDDELEAEHNPFEDLTEFVFELSDGSAWLLPVKKFEQYRKTFPHLDLECQLSRAAQWLLDNPRQRKTKRGICRYIFNWLSNAQDKPRKSYGDSDSGNGSRVASLDDMKDYRA